VDKLRHSHITTIGEIEKVIGIDFLPGVTGAKRAAMENSKQPHCGRKNKSERILSGTEHAPVFVRPHS
jgi:hypothetical protein